MKLIKGRVALYTFTLLALACAGCKQEPPVASQPPSPAAANTSPQPATQPEAQPSAANGSPAVKGKIDACRLITGEEIQSVQRDALKETKASEQNSGGFATAQCFYTTNNFVNSISLTVTQKDPANAGGPSVRDYWKETFGSAQGREKEREKEREKDAKGGEEEGESRPPQKVKSLGDEAYWVGNQKVGVLYVLTGDKFLRISIGGADSQRVKTEKMKTLARQVIKRL